MGVFRKTALNVDLGIFWNRRIGFGGWLAGPVAIWLLFCVPAHIYWRGVNASCDRKEALLEQIPEFNRQVALGRSVLANFIPPETEGVDLLSTLNMRVQETAARHDVSIRSLVTDPKALVATSAVTTVTLSLESEGELASLLRTVEELEEPQSLCAVQSFRLAAIGTSLEQRYRGDIVLKCVVIKPSEIDEQN